MVFFKAYNRTVHQTLQPLLSNTAERWLLIYKRLKPSYRVAHDYSELLIAAEKRVCSSLNQLFAMRELFENILPTTCVLHHAHFNF